MDGINDVTRSFNFADLPCPPSTLAFDPMVPNPLQGNTQALSAFIQSYHPRILAPHQSILDLDPAWNSSNCEIIDVGQGYDPPRPLVPATGWFDDATAANDDPLATTTPPVPQSSLTPPGSQATLTDSLKLQSVPTTKITHPDPVPDPRAPSKGNPRESPELDPPAPPDRPATDSPEITKTIFVKSTAAPVPHPVEQPPDLQPVVAGGLTLIPAQASPASRPSPLGVVIGGLTLTAPKSTPNPVRPQPLPAHLSPLPIAAPKGSALFHTASKLVIVGGFTFTPVQSDLSREHSPSNVVAGSSADHLGDLNAIPLSPLIVGGVTLDSPDSTPFPTRTTDTGNVVFQNGENIQPQQGLVITVGRQTGQLVQVGPSTAVFGSHTLTIGSASANIGGTPASLGPSEFAVGSSKFALSPTAPSYQLPHVVVGNKMPSSDPAMFLVDGQTLSRGGSAVTVSNTKLSFGSAGLHIGTSFVPIESLLPQPLADEQSDVGSKQIFNIAGNTFTPNPIAFPVAGTTVVQGSQAVTIANTPVSFGPSGLQIGGSIIPNESLLPKSGPEVQSPELEPLVFSVAGTRISQGGPGITISGTSISFGSLGLVVGTKTMPLTPNEIPFAPKTATQQGSIYSIGGNVVTQGGPAITVSGTRISLGPTALVIGSSTVKLPSLTQFKFKGSMITPNPTGFPIAGTTLHPGGAAITISGTRISLGTVGLVIGSQTVPLPTASPTVFFIGSNTITANRAGISLAGTTLFPGGPGITVSGTPVSLGDSDLVIGSHTYQLPPLQSVFTIGGQVITANPTGFPIRGTTLQPNDPVITISGTKVSLGPSDLVIGSSTFVLPPKPYIFTTDGQVFTELPGELAFGGKTISAGGPGVTISGLAISEGSSFVVIGSETLRFPASTKSPRRTKPTSTSRAAMMTSTDIIGTQTRPPASASSTSTAIKAYPGFMNLASSLLFFTLLVSILVYI